MWKKSEYGRKDPSTGALLIVVDNRKWLSQALEGVTVKKRAVSRAPPAHQTGPRGRSPKPRGTALSVHFSGHPSVHGADICRTSAA